MPSSEFSLIERYFRDTGISQPSTVLSQGDDAAVIEVPTGHQLVMSIDTLIAGVHFPVTSTPADIAHKALAVNLSDLAAMAATPGWFLLSISLPDSNETWLAKFSQSLKKIADQYAIELIGGDTCRGPLSISIQVNGLVKNNQFVARHGAQAGDVLVVSGQLGNAALGLAHLQGKINLPETLRPKCIHALKRPTPRLCLKDFLTQYAHAAIDLSDGLVGDLRHMLNASGTGAVLYQPQLPVEPWVKENDGFQYALSGGDDYELCFSLLKEHVDRIDDWNRLNPDCVLSVIGEVTESGYFLSNGESMLDLCTARGYQHFGS